MRGTTLATLRQMFKAEVGADIDSAVAPGGDSVTSVILANEQKWLVNTFDWSFMKKRLDIALTTGTRYYAVPTVTLTDGNGATYVVDAINFEVQPAVKVKWGAIWITDPVKFGINEIQFQSYDSDAARQVDPVTRWDWDNSTAALRIEVWPTPNSAQTLRFVGQRPLNPLVADTDTADLDDLLIVYYAAAKFLARAKQDDAVGMIKKAEARMNQLRGSQQSIDNGRFILGGGSDNARERLYNNRPRVFHG
jgi:hypothetical protein